MRRSLRFRLTISIVSVLAVTSLALSLVVYLLFAGALSREFEQRLLGEAAAVAGMAEDDVSLGKAEFEYEALPEFERTSRPAYFEAWLDDGRVLARSSSLGARDLGRSPRASSDPVTFDLRLPDGRAGRALQLRQPLRREGESEAEPPGPPGQSERLVTVIVARSTDEMNATLASVKRWLFALVLLTVSAASAAAALAVSRGLRPARALTNQIASLDSDRFHALDVRDLPDELAPLGQKLNELLARLHASFAREKRFTADVSHELRTPLAALRTMFDVTLSRGRSAPEYHATFVDAAAVVQQMQHLCENLLALARLDAGAGPRSLAVELDLAAAVDDGWRLVARTARDRGLTFRNDVAPGTMVTTDPGCLRVIVGNLLANAVTYTASGGTIEVRRRSVTVPDAWLEVYDTGPPIPSEALPHLFERFFRGDASRSNAAALHCGIGLALVSGFAETIGLKGTARNTPDGGVSFALIPRDR